MMKKLLLFMGVVLVTTMASAQAIYERISSLKLDETREIKIQLPRNYEKNKEKKYPVLLVLDGDYLFEPVAGMVDYYSYWEEMPEMIVVGVTQPNSREEDTSYDDQNFLPADKGANFFEFLGMELLAKIDNSYRTTNFHLAIGHDITANFIDYYILKENPLFDAYINLSPDLAPRMPERIAAAFQKTEKPRWFYLATGSDDIASLQQNIKALDTQLKSVKNDMFTYKFDDFKNTSHYSLVGNAIPSALESIFSTYAPISSKEYNEVLLQTSVSAYNFLIEKYENINKLYNVEKQIRISDFIAVSNAIEKTHSWEDLKSLSKLADDEYPKTMLGTYFDARYEEETGNPKRAMKTYQKAYGQEPIAFLTVDFMLEKADAIKKEFGY